MGRKKLNFEELGLSIPDVDAFIKSYIFSKRNRKIVSEKWFDDITFEKLAEKYKLSERQTKNIVGRAEKQLCQHFHLDI